MRCWSLVPVVLGTGCFPSHYDERPAISGEVATGTLDHPEPLPSVHLRVCGVNPSHGGPSSPRHCTQIVTDAAGHFSVPAVQVRRWSSLIAEDWSEREWRVLVVICDPNWTGYDEIAHPANYRLLAGPSQGQLHPLCRQPEESPHAAGDRGADHFNSQEATVAKAALVLNHGLSHQ